MNVNPVAGDSNARVREEIICAGGFPIQTIQLGFEMLRHAREDSHSQQFHGKVVRGFLSPEIKDHGWPPPYLLDVLRVDGGDSLNTISINPRVGITIREHEVTHLVVPGTVGPQEPNKVVVVLRLAQVGGQVVRGETRPMDFNLRRIPGRHFLIDDERINLRDDIISVGVLTVVTVELPPGLHFLARGNHLGFFLKLVSLSLRGPLCLELAMSDPTSE